MTKDRRSRVPKQRPEQTPIEDIGAYYEQLVQDGGRKILEIFNDILGADRPKPDEAACRAVYARCFSAKNKFESNMKFQAAYRRVGEAADALADALRALMEFPEGHLLFDIHKHLDRIAELGGVPGPHFKPRKPNSRSEYHPLVRHFAGVVEAALREAGHTTLLSPKKDDSLTGRITDQILEIFELRPEGASANDTSYTSSVFREPRRSRARKSDDVPFDVRFPNAARIRKL